MLIEELLEGFIFFIFVPYKTLGRDLEDSTQGGPYLLKSKGGHEQGFVVI